MDIFTTVLRKVVPAPIKPKKLKVKPVLKEGGTGKLMEDQDHLENHDYYFSLSEKDNAAQENPQENNSLPKDNCQVLAHQDISDEDKKNEKLDHLDIFI
tara:strand:- start:780 stop:1076 length:297 start_codon:yes stop_codon:yes gene_type:complete